MQTIDLDQWKYIFVSVAEAISGNEMKLNELDRLIGDGDHGSSITRGFKSARTLIENSTFGSVSELFSKVGSVMLQDIGGAIGPLIGTFFMAAGKPAQDKNNVDLPLWTLMFASGIERVRSFGKAKPGDKTMLDALQPALEAFEEAAGRGLPLELAFRNAAAAARYGADQTSEMVAKFGRAKFVGERSLGHQDPGANSIWVMLNAMADSISRIASTEDPMISQ